GWISAILFTLSYGAIVYTRWLSSHPLSIPLSVLFFYCLFQYLNGKKNALFGVAIVYGLVGQTEFLNFIFFAAILIITAIAFRKEFFAFSKKFLFLNFLILAVFSTGNYLLFDIRN